MGAGRRHGVSKDIVNICISAVVCTLNRAKYLRQALCSLGNQTLSKEEYEIVVVDNGSTDETQRVVLQEFAHLSNLRYFYEPLLGLSRARNTGWRNSRGDYIAFLDDDAVASAGWLEKILDVFLSVNPQPGCVGGKIEAIWEIPPPPWLSDGIGSYLGMLDLSANAAIIDADQYLFGGNIAIPKSLLLSLDEFNAALGRKGERLLGNEEVLLQKQIRAHGHSCYYDPTIYVGHHVPAWRLSKSWFMRRLFWQGVCDALVKLEEESLSMQERIKEGLRVAGKMLFSRRQLSYLAVPTNDPRRFELKCHNVARVGYVLGMWGLVR